MTNSSKFCVPETGRVKLATENLELAGEYLAAAQRRFERAVELAKEHGVEPALIDQLIGGESVNGVVQS